MDDAKPLVDPYCLCGHQHPCPEHGDPDQVQPRLFDAEPSSERRRLVNA